MLSSLSRILAEAIYLCRHFFLTYSLVYITETVFLPFLNASSAKKQKKTVIYKSEYKAENIMQWFCRAIKLCIVSIKIYVAIMVKVTFEIKIFSLKNVKKSFTGHPRDLFFAIRVIGNKQVFQAGFASPLVNTNTIARSAGCPSKEKSDADLQSEPTPFPVAYVQFHNVADGAEYCAKKNKYCLYKYRRDN